MACLFNLTDLNGVDSHWLSCETVDSEFPRD